MALDVFFPLVLDAGLAIFLLSAPGLMPPKLWLKWSSASCVLPITIDAEAP